MSQLASPTLGHDGRGDRLSSFQIVRSPSYRQGRPHQQTRLASFDCPAINVLPAGLKGYRNWNGHSYAERHLEEWVSRCPSALFPGRVVHVLASQNYGKLGEGEEAIDLLLLDDLCQFHVLELKAKRIAARRGVTPDNVHGQMSRYVGFLRKELPDFPLSLSTYFHQFTEDFVGTSHDLETYLDQNLGRPFVRNPSPVLCRIYLTEGYDDDAVEYFRLRQQQGESPTRLVYYRFYPDPDRDRVTGCKDRIEFWEVPLSDGGKSITNPMSLPEQHADGAPAPSPSSPLPIELADEAPAPANTQGRQMPGDATMLASEPGCDRPSTAGPPSLDAVTYIVERQTLWARRHGIALQGSAGDRGRPAYTQSLEDNLFEPLSEEARGEYERGQGEELTQNMRAVHSSSALTCNVFHYWKSRGLPAPIAAACRLPADNLVAIRFEARHPIAENLNRDVFRFDPNLDVEFLYGTGQRVKAAAIECKFSEPFGSWGHTGIKRAYLMQSTLWDGMPHCRDLATRLSPDDSEFRHLHAAQLLKHLLGLKHAYRLDEFILTYLWYDVPGSEGWQHRQEVERFGGVVRQDGIDFRAVTYQEVLHHLAHNHRNYHTEYVDYLAERYF